MDAQMLNEMHAWVQEERRERQVKRMILLRDVDRSVFEDIKERAGISPAYEPALDLPSSMTGICYPAFRWGNDPKRSQACSYIPFLQAHIHLGIKDNVWIDAASCHQHLLRCSASSGLSRNLRETTEVAICHQGAAAGNVPQLGLCFFLEVRKGSISDSDVTQAMAALLLAILPNDGQCR